jgi:hypothetical protein
VERALQGTLLPAGFDVGRKSSKSGDSIAETFLIPFRQHNRAIDVLHAGELADGKSVVSCAQHRIGARRREIDWKS